MATSKSSRPPSRHGTPKPPWHQLAVRISLDLHKALKVHSIETGETIQVLIERAAWHVLGKRGAQVVSSKKAATKKARARPKKPKPKVAAEPKKKEPTDGNGLAS